MDGDEGLSASLIFPDGAPTWQCPEFRVELRSAICLACFVRRLLRGRQLRKIYGTSDGPLAGLELREPELSRYVALRAAKRRGLTLEQHEEHLKRQEEARRCQNYRKVSPTKKRSGLRS